MAVSDSYVAYVVGKLSNITPITARPMFGGLAIYRNNISFALLANDHLYFKADGRSRRKYHTLGMPAFQPLGEDSARARYYQVPETVLDSQKKLESWLEVACNAGGKSHQRNLLTGQCDRQPRSRRKLS